MFLVVLFMLAGNVLQPGSGAATARFAQFFAYVSQQIETK